MALQWEYNPDKPIRSSPNWISYLATHKVTAIKGNITFFHFPTDDEKEKLTIRIKRVRDAIHRYEGILPNIAKIQDHGEENGEPYVVEEYIEGASLRETYSKYHTMPLSVVLSLCRQMVRVFQFMHASQICHFGICSMRIIEKKQPPPDPQAPVAPAQEPVFVLTGWKFDQPVDETYVSVDRLYLAPEIFDAATFGEPGERSDRYALAVVLYEALTGELPLKQEEGDDRIKITSRHTLDDPFVNAIQQPLQKFFRKALKKQPGDRHQSVHEFLDDFEEVCRHIEPALRVVTPPPAVPKTPGGIPPVDTKQVALNKPVPRRSLMIALAALMLLIWELVEAVSRPPHKNSKAKSPAPQLGGLILSFDKHEATVNAAIPSPDGFKIASVDASSRLILWSALDGHSHFYWDDPFMHQRKPIAGVAWDPTSNFFSTDDISGGLVLWSVQHGAISRYYPLPASSQAISWARYGDHLIAAGGNQVYIFDNPVGKKLGLTDPPYGGHSGLINALAISPDGVNAVSVSNDGTVQVWTIESRTKQYTIPCESLEELSSVAYSPDGRWIAIGSEDGSVCIWDVPNRKFTFRYRHDAAVRAVAWSPDSRSIASGGDDNVVLLYNIDSKDQGKLYYTYKGHNDNVLSVAWHTENSIISAANKEIHIWRARV